MKFFDTIGNTVDAVIKFVVEQKDKALVALGLGMSGLAPTASNAAVTVDSTTGAMSGSFDLAPFYSAIAIVVTAICVVAAIGLAIKTFKKVA